VFVGWTFNDGDQNRPNLGLYCYRNGVAMGSDLSGSSSGDILSPHVVIQAIRDPNAVNLDHIQTVKGWVDEEKQLQERIYDVACSDNRATNKEVVKKQWATRSILQSQVM
jgi:hypothetical protein